jgi:hypothetical protein
MTLPPLSEKDFLTQVTQLAAIRGWQWLHLRPGMTRDSWRTPISGPLGKGWPDLLLCRDKRLIFCELKRAGAQPSPEQVEVLRVLSGVGQTFVWTPLDWPTIEGVLR